MVPPLHPDTSLYGADSVRHTFFFFFNDTATTEIYTLSLHDALPISAADARPSDLSTDLSSVFSPDRLKPPNRRAEGHGIDRKSTRLNSSHMSISYAVFCLKKKKKKTGRHLHGP